MAIYPAHQVAACLGGGPPLLWQPSLQGTVLVGHTWDDGGTRAGSFAGHPPLPHTWKKFKSPSWGVGGTKGIQTPSCLKGLISLQEPISAF